jgi:hypothetical protein
MRRATGILFSSAIGITNSGHLAYPGRDGLRPVPLFSRIRLKEIEDGQEFQFDSRAE